MPGLDRRRFLAQTAGALTGISLLPDRLDLGPIRLRQPVRVGLVGTGRQGRAILAELAKLPDVTIAGLCDTSPGRLRVARERTAGAEGFADHRAMLERAQVQAVIVATPTHLHREIVEHALQAGMHVYCEAPLAHTEEDCRAIVAAAAAASTITQAGFQARSNPIYLRTRPLVRTELRDLVSLYAQHHRKTSWRFPPSEAGAERAVNWRLDPAVSLGLAGEIAAHQLDAVTWLVGEPPARVSGRGAIRLHRDGREVADTIQIGLEWADGLAMHYGATLANSYGGEYEVLHGANAAVKLAGTHGWLFKEADAPTQGWEVYATRQQFFGDEGIVLVVDATKLAEQGRLKEGAGLPHPPLYYALADFLRSVTEGAPVACPAADGSRSTVLGILANQAVLEGRSVTVEGLR
jgi:predicted dehydrogenase